MSAPPTAILLAAGLGQRYRAASGRAGADKLMAPLDDGTPVVLAAARNVLAVLPQVIAVVRDEQGPAALALRESGARTVMAANAHLGIGHSLATGVGASSDATGWIVLLADMPFIKPTTIRQIASRMTSPQALVAPTYQGQRGHPVGFGSAHLSSLLALTGDEGARTLLRKRADDIQLIEVADPGVLMDIDTPGMLDIQSLP